MKKLLLILCASLSLLATADVLTDAAKEIAEISSLLESEKAPVRNDSFKARAVSAFITALDPQATILSVEEMELVRDEDRGVYYGIGVNIQVKDGLPEISKIHEGGPASLSELTAGDVIEQIDGRDTEGEGAEKLLEMLRGEKGEAVELKVKGKKKDSEQRVVSVVRDTVYKLEESLVEEWPNGIGYIKLSGLYEDAGVRVAEQLRIWVENKYSGVILDLRDIGGADLESVSRIAELFAGEGEALFSVTNGKDEQELEYLAEAGDKISIPLMLLIDSRTSGAAATLAAVLKGRSGVLLIGSPTGSDDRIRGGIAMSDGRMLYIGTKRVLPSDRPSYGREGVRPDILLSESELSEPPATSQSADDDEPYLFSGRSKEERANKALTTRVEADPALRRATDILLGIKALSARSR